MRINRKRPIPVETVLAPEIRSDAMFRHRQQLRRWAARVLLLWLFGVAAGVANACLGPGPVEGDAGASVHAGDAPYAQHAVSALPDAPDHSSHAPIHPDGAHDPAASPASSNCQDFCDKASVSLPSLKSTLDNAQAQALSPLMAATVLPVPAFVPVQLREPRRDGVSPLPIPLAFLRLTL